MPGWDYDYSGLRVRSQWQLPEWACFQVAPHAEPEVLISLQGLPPANGAPPEPGAEPYEFQVPEVGQFWVRGGREIRVLPEPGAEPRSLRLFLLGSAWAALCYQRGLLVLHVSAVATPAGVLAFCGPSGAGKSATAAWLVERGYPLVSDDLCRFETSPNGILVHPSTPRLKLWSDALAGLGRSAAGLERDHFRQDKYHLAVAPLGGGPLPLAGICLLEWGDAGLARLTGHRALSRLVTATAYRGSLLAAMGQVAATWERCAALLRQVPVWQFQRPRQWAAMPGAMGGLLAGLPFFPEPRHDGRGEAAP